MSMLAEPKRKQKFGPDPRNTLWGNDESKFGFRMLESMGWKKGRGLGAKEDGMTEHIKAEARSNDDVRGVGCSRKVANNWIPHQDDFNSLLSSLNSATNKVDDNSKSAKTSVASVSLEQKSKSSRTRVHYHKFTRGKDLSSRSVHELACIFGWQKGQTSETASPTTQSEANSDEDGSTSNDSKASDKSDDKEAPSHGVKTITSSSSVQEYFAMKMAELKQKRETASASVNASSVNSSIDSETVEDTNNNDSKENLVGLVNSDDSAPVDKQRKKKKKKKQKCEEHEDSFRCEDQQDGVSEHVGSMPCETSQEADAVCEARGQELSRSKKKEKRKKKVVHETALDDSSINESADIQPSEHDINQEFQKPAKKAKKRKISDVDQCESEALQTCQTTDQDCTSEDVNGEPEKKKKKKKKKKKQKSAETEEESHNSSILRQENDGKTRRRKSVRFSLGEVEVFTIPNKEEEKLQQQKDEPLESESSKEREQSENKSVEKKLSKKRKRQKAQEEETQKTEKQDLQTEEDDVPKKKKRKSQDEGKEGTQKKKKSKPRKEDKDTNQDEHVEKASQVECAKNGERSESSLVQSDSSEDDTENVTNKTEAGSSVALFDEKRMRNSQPVSVADADSIIASFVGSNLSSVKGYGSSM